MPAMAKPALMQQFTDPAFRTTMRRITNVGTRRHQAGLLTDAGLERRRDVPAAVRGRLRSQDLQRQDVCLHKRRRHQSGRPRAGLLGHDEPGPPLLRRRPGPDPLPRGDEPRGGLSHALELPEQRGGRLARVDVVGLEVPRPAVRWRRRDLHLPDGHGHGHGVDHGQPRSWATLDGRQRDPRPLGPRGGRCADERLAGDRHPGRGALVAGAARQRTRHLQRGRIRRGAERQRRRIAGDPRHDRRDGARDHRAGHRLPVPTDRNARVRRRLQEPRLGVHLGRGRHAWTGCARSGAGPGEHQRDRRGVPHRPPSLVRQGRPERILGRAPRHGSPTGTRAVFASDWGGGSSVDTYVVELPSYRP